MWESDRNGKAAHFRNKCLECKHCVGLPQERLIVLEEITRKFAVVAVSSKGKLYFWNPNDKRKLLEKEYIFLDFLFNYY